MKNHLGKLNFTYFLYFQHHQQLKQQQQQHHIPHIALALGLKLFLPTLLLSLTAAAAAAATANMSNVMFSVEFSVWQKGRRQCYQYLRQQVCGKVLMHYTITLLQLQLSNKFTDLLKVNQLQAPYREREKFVPKQKTKLQLVLVHFLCTALQIFYFVSLLELILCRTSTSRSQSPPFILYIYIQYILCCYNRTSAASSTDCLHKFACEKSFCEQKLWANKFYECRKSLLKATTKILLLRVKAAEGKEKEIYCQ